MRPLYNADWVRLVAEAIEPLAAALLREMLRYDYWHADETGIAVLDNTKKKDTHQGYFEIFIEAD
jgi:hypothetical protein